MLTYKALNLGAPVGQGINRAVTVQIDAVAKCCNDRSPYLVANEWVAAGLAHYLCLPVPRCCTVELDGVHYFVSLNFNLTGEELPPVQPARVVERFPGLSAGIIVFDTWVANCDRHAGNLAAVLETEPHRLTFYDHDRCLLGHQAGGGTERLSQVAHELVIDGSLGGNRHCLMPHVEDASHFEEWLTRLEATPRWLIAELAAEVQAIGAATQQEAQAITDFLDCRKPRVRTMLRQAVQQGLFPAVTEGGLF